MILALLAAAVVQSGAATCLTAHEVELLAEEARLESSMAVDSLTAKRRANILAAAGLSEKYALDADGEIDRGMGYAATTVALAKAIVVLRHNGLICKAPKP